MTKDDLYISEKRARDTYLLLSRAKISPEDRKTVMSYILALQAEASDMRALLEKANANLDSLRDSAEKARKALEGFVGGYSYLDDEMLGEG